VKRALDFCVALVGLLATWPFLALIAVLVRLDSPGPVIYKHRRVGKDGRLFNLVKFRSMATGGDDGKYMDYLQELIESEKNGESKPYRKMEDDPRITGVGKFLRSTYLDELPQLWNILKGDMSLVGPRPHVEFEVGHYTPEQRRRLSVRPGMTGLWQVEGKAECSFGELIELDLKYIDEWSLGLDVRLVLNTLRLMIQGGQEVWARRAKRVPGSE